MRTPHCDAPRSPRNNNPARTGSAWHCSPAQLLTLTPHPSDPPSLQNATEVDVDCLADRTGAVTIGGIMEHIEQAGVHSGDSACSIPTQTIPPHALATIRDWTAKLAKR